MGENLHLIVIAGLLVVAYAIVANRLMVLGDALRRRALRSGEKLIGDDRVPELVKLRIREIMPALTMARAAWVSVAVMPVAVFTSEPKGNYTVPADLRGCYSEHQLAAIGAMLSNSPAASFVFVCEIAVMTYFVGLHMIVDAVLRSAVSHVRGAHHMRNDGAQSASA